MLDQAGSHGSAKLVTANITLLSLPPRSLELNPAEIAWQFMRDSWLSNRVFSSYDDIVGHCSKAWNKLVAAGLVIDRHAVGAATLVDAICVAGGGAVTGGSVPSAVHEAFTFS